MRSYEADALRAILKQRSGRSYGLLVKSALCALKSAHACCEHAVVHAGDSMLR
jgi:hypothetical protein